MQKKSEQILDLLTGGQAVLKEARLRALKITKEIQGFGNDTTSPPSSSSSSGSSSRTSFGSYSTTSSVWNDMEPEITNTNTNIPKETLGSYGLGGIYDDDEKPTTLRQTNENLEAVHLWGSSSSGQERGSLLKTEGDEDAGKDGFISGICSKLVGKSPTSMINVKKATLRNYSDVGTAAKKTYHRQFSAHY